MTHRRGYSVTLGAVSVLLSASLDGSAWALPHHAHDTGWGKGSLHGKLREIL